MWDHFYVATVVRQPRMIAGEGRGEGKSDTARQVHATVEKVVVAKDGVEALEHLFSPATSDANLVPAFVILDLNLPRLSGLAVPRRIRAEKSTRMLPVIVLTGSRDEQNIAE
jgi:CheY-like chemotaxis protein